MKTRTILSTNLIEQRKKLKLSQKATAKIIGVHFSTYNNWEYSLANPGIDKLIALSNLFGVLVDDLIGNNSWIEIGEQKPENPTYNKAYRIFATFKNSTFSEDAIYKNGKWFINGTDITKQVTHWRPLPAPPKK